MNHTMISLVLLATTVAEAYPIMNNNEKKFTSDFIEALRINCVSDFVKLIPTLDEFQRLMDLNADVYGPFLSEAKEEFANQYERMVLTKLTSEFESLIQDGRKRGIVWHELEVLGFENEASNNSTTSFVITIQSGKKVHRILVEDALFINGLWRLGRAIKFV